MSAPHVFNGSYEGAELKNLGFPIGGIGSGMFTLDGTGSLTRWSLRHKPNLFSEAVVFAALRVSTSTGGTVARVLEGPVPEWRPLFPWNRHWQSSGTGGGIGNWGLPRFDSARFEARFPFGKVTLQDDRIPLETSVTGWNPFIPGDADGSSLPVGTLEYTFRNPAAEPVEAVFSFHAKNFIGVKEEGQSVEAMQGGFVFRQTALPDDAAAEGAAAIWTTEPGAATDACWFRGGWFDPLTMVWKKVEQGNVDGVPAATEGKPSPGGSLYVKFTLAPGESRTVPVFIAWRVPFSTVRITIKKENPDPRLDFYRPWYATEFETLEQLVQYWNGNGARLRRASVEFRDAFYDSTLPPEVVEAIAANLTILKSPTVLRQFDGRMWAWEGSQDEQGSCHGTCTHVWNYAQALSHLFPALERGLRETEFNLSQDETGHQCFRAAIPLSPASHDFHAAADGQLGGIIKTYREWRISGDTGWLRGLWPKVRQSLDYCIRSWDPDQIGVLIEPHHNTYDIEFWGANGMCGSFYLAALNAAVVMGRALGDDVSGYEEIAAAGKKYMEEKLYDGEYFIQNVQWTGLRAKDPIAASEVGIMMNYSTEAKALLDKEGPKYQYGDGCLSDGILGEWMAWTAGLGPVIDPAKIESHVVSVHRYNYRGDLAKFANPQRPAYAFGHEAGLVMCTWPKSEALSLPFPYSNEVWTGIEYHIASHLISLGHVEEGLQIVRACRARYSGTVRNPFDELECGHWYARAMASYALLQALSGARYDAIERTLYLAPKIKGDFRSFLSTATGFGTVGVKDGKPFVEVKSGQIPVDRIEYTA